MTTAPAVGSTIASPALQPRREVPIAYEADVVAQEKVNVILSNHAKYDGSLERMAKLAMRKPGDAHPYVIGHEAVGRAIKVIGECARSFLTSFDAEGK
jgi:hypothetical protein